MAVCFRCSWHVYWMGNKYLAFGSPREVEIYVLYIKMADGLRQSKRLVYKISIKLMNFNKSISFRSL